MTVLMLGAVMTASAASVDPIIVNSWTSGGGAAAECVLAGGCGDSAYKIDGWDQMNEMDGTYNETITIYNSDGDTFDWSSTEPVCTVIVKAGTGANIYYYPGGSMGDTGLVAYANKGISHATFCYSEGNGGIEETLTVTKTAVTSYTRTHYWIINKSVATADGWMHQGYPKIWLYTDGTGDELATWTVDVTYDGFTDSDHVVSGDITILNTGTESVVINGINDVLAGTPITVTYPVTLPYTLAAGDTLTCTYSKEGYVEGYNEVVVEFNAVDATTDPFTTSATADIVWGDPTTEVNDEVNIEDSSDLFGEDVPLGTATAPNHASFIYTKDFAWADYGESGFGDYTYENTATIVETGQSASETLKVNVQGYDYETAYAKGDDAICFTPTFSNWGWTNPIMPGTYTWDLWAGAAQCDASKGTLVGTVAVVYGDDGYVTASYTVNPPNILKETHVYAGTTEFPMKKGVPTVAPGAYYNVGPFVDPIYVIAHAVVGIPDPDFGPQV